MPVNICKPSKSSKPPKEATGVTVTMEDFHNLETVVTALGQLSNNSKKASHSLSSLGVLLASPSGFKFKLNPKVHPKVINKPNTKAAKPENGSGMSIQEYVKSQKGKHSE